MNTAAEDRASAKRARKALAQLRWAYAGGDWWLKNFEHMLAYWRRQAQHNLTGNFHVR